MGHQVGHARAVNLAVQWWILRSHDLPEQLRFDTRMWIRVTGKRRRLLLRWDKSGAPDGIAETNGMVRNGSNEGEVSGGVGQLSTLPSRGACLPFSKLSTALLLTKKRDMTSITVARRSFCPTRASSLNRPGAPSPSRVYMRACQLPSEKEQTWSSEPPSSFNS